MKNKLWLTQVPVLLFFTFCFWVIELGVHGQLQSVFLRETVYPVISKISNGFTDFKFMLRGPRPPTNKIVVLEIDSASIDKFGRWPWHRDTTAALIAKTFEAGAKVIGLDMTFSEPDIRVPPALVDLLKTHHLDASITSFETDLRMRETILKYSDQLVLGWTTDTPCQPLYEPEQFCSVTNPDAIALYPSDYEKFAVQHFDSPPGFDPGKTPMLSFVTPIANLPLYNDAARHAGFFNATLDSDGHIRRANLVAIAKGKPFPSLALEMARIGLKDELKIQLDTSYRIQSIGFKNANRDIPTTPVGAMQINFRGPSAIFPHVTAEEVLTEGEEFKKVATTLKDAYVLLGVSAVGVFDMRQFPFEANSAGVYGHANILDNILTGDPLVSGENIFESIALLLLMTVGVGLFAYFIEGFSAVPALILFVSTFGGLGLIDIRLMFWSNHNWNSVFLYLELGVVFILTIAAKYVLEEKNKKFIRSAFAKYVPPSVVDSILKDPTKLSLGGEKRDMTILFSDIRSFTTFSEKMDAKGLASFLNDYLGVMTGLVFSNTGTLDKYIGDAVMAFWGAPLPQPNHAWNSCQSAIQMMQALEKNFERFRKDYGIDVEIGIGINSGVVNVGNMGSEQNFEYTVIGDHVNLASRLEGLTKKYRAGIVTSNFTIESIQKSGQPIPANRILDEVKVKGKKNAVQLVEVLTREIPEEALKSFAQGRAHYLKRKWDEAIQSFQKTSQLVSAKFGKADGPSEMFIERCVLLKETPPEKDWDGSWEMDSK